MKRIFDMVISFMSVALLAPLILVIALLIMYESKGPVLFWSDRVGRDNKIFKMAKFRTMNSGAPILATHLLSDTAKYITPLGAFLRKSSLDELPQLWNILIGNMSFVGPRPALFNQDDLIKLRSDHGVDKIMPGLTGWAQVNGRDELSIQEKVQFDTEYLKMQSFELDIKILYLTFLKVLQRSGISH